MVASVSVVSVAVVSNSDVDVEEGWDVVVAEDMHDVSRMDINVKL
jgi:hypothetical protein